MLGVNVGFAVGPLGPSFAFGNFGDVADGTWTVAGGFGSFNLGTVALKDLLPYNKMKELYEKAKAKATGAMPPLPAAKEPTGADKAEARRVAAETEAGDARSRAQAAENTVSAKAADVGTKEAALREAEFKKQIFESEEAQNKAKAELAKKAEETARMKSEYEAVAKQAAEKAKFLAVQDEIKTKAQGSPTLEAGYMGEYNRRQAAFELEETKKKQAQLQEQLKHKEKHEEAERQALKHAEEVGKDQQKLAAAKEAAEKEVENAKAAKTAADGQLTTAQTELTAKEQELEAKK